MSAAPEGSGRAHIAEGFTIFVGILLALTVDASWDFLQDRARERELLEGLHIEFVRNREELASDQQRRVEIQRSISNALDATESGAHSLSEADARSAVTALLDFRFYTPSHPVLEDVIQSGSLSLVRSESVRRALLAYVQERDRLTVVEERERDFVAAEVEPYLTARLEMARPAANDESFGPRVDGAVVERILAAPELRSIAYLRWERTDTSRRFSAGLARSIERVIEAIEEG